MKKSIFVYFLFIIFLTGCATWEQVGGVYETSSHNYKTELPNEWRRFNLDRSQVLITKDGFSLQWISVSRTPIDKKLDFTQKKYSKHMLPQEAAEVAIANFRSNPQIFNMQIVENDPVLIGGYAGFKIVYQYQTDKGLTKKGVYYCSLVDEWSYKINYEAPARYYFERDLPALELVKEKFKLLKDSPSQIKKVTEVKSDTPVSQENKRPQATVAMKGPSDNLTTKEPWTGVWKVESSSMYQGGIWALKQSGKTVVSTRQSRYKLKGKVEGNQLKGKFYYGPGSAARTFSIKISSDGQSFKGTADVWQGTAHLKGKRKE
jgi:hypothetical protein